MKISVVIQTYNSEKFLERVLESVEKFDEIVICDMYSTDRTLSIVEKYNCKLIFHEHTGIVEPARNYAISNASNNWVLVIDSDEIVTKELREYLYDFFKKNKDVDGICIPRKNFFLGRFMHASYPDYVLRFLNKNVTDWPSTVHAKPIVRGTVINIPKSRTDLALVHLVNSSIKVRIEKLNIYTDFEIVKRKGKKNKTFALIFGTFGRFLHYYVFKCGFKDGVAGLIFAMQGAFYKFVTVAKIIESKVDEKDYDKDLRS